MSRITLFTITFLFISIGYAQETPCKLILQGRIVDGDTQLPVAGATVKLEPGATQIQSDGHGYFRFLNLCKADYVLEISHIGFDGNHRQLTLEENLTLTITLTHGTIHLHDAHVVGHQRKVSTANPTKTIAGIQLAEARGETLAAALRQLPGISTLQTGNTISKPVINGMHGNRILVLNNGIRQEGQQWGSEHAPEIDPFIAKELTVIKGAEGVQYGADAIGGVILVSPPSMPVDPRLSGELHAIGNHNGRSGAVSGMLGSAIRGIKGLSWRAQGTAKRSGNLHTAAYHMGNTGSSEHNFSTTLNYAGKTTEIEGYYSRFQTELGILYSAHIGNIDDIQARIDAGRPLETYNFTYDIQAPRQVASHDLGKLKLHKDYRDGSSLDIQYGLQRNHRKEYDSRRGDRDALPMLDMVLTTQNLDASYSFKTNSGLKSKFGINAMTQVNNNVPGTQNTPLIPNYDSFNIGAFVIERLVRDGFELEAGIRYDFKTFDAAGFDSQLQSYGGYRQFHNVSGSVGALWHINPEWQIRSNLGLAWRAPSANELYSNGLHHGAATYELGNPDMNSEQGYKWSTSITYAGGQLSIALDPYVQYIHNYSYARPNAGEYWQSIRGTFPVFKYTQTDATFWGIDFTAQYTFPAGFSYQLDAAIIRAKDVNAGTYLPYIPADNMEHHVRWEIPFNGGNLKNTYIKATHTIVARQSRYDIGTDYAAPPPAYQLVALHIGTTLPIRGNNLSITLSSTNMFDRLYKEYMNRFRYFSHDMGRNTSIKIAYHF